MLGSGWRRGAFVGLAAAGAALVIGAGVGLTLASSATRPHPATSHPAAQQRAVARVMARPSGAALTVTPPPSSGQAASRQPVPPRSAVPWGSVGPGWVLDTYSAGTRVKPAPTTLYLVSPGGAKYPLLSWPVSAGPVPTLEAWAGNKTEALFQLHSPNGVPDGYGELNLVTQAMTRVAFASSATTPVGYTLPTGEQVLGVTQSGSDATFARYTQAGALVKTLVTDAHGLGASYSPDGMSLAVPADGRLLLVSNATGVTTSLAVPGAGAKAVCQPVRWWNPTTILANCGRLWLVPDTGAAPSALTPVRDTAQARYDLGDIDAWQLPSGLYLQSLGACGTLELNRQAANGSVSRVIVPGMTDSPVVVTAAGAQLLVEQQGCEGSGGQLAWFDPATGAEHWLFTTGAGASAVAYDSPENGTIF
jgi:hypothetical protein